MNNSDLKKVGLVFKADGTTDFIKSLQNINGTLQENYSRFKLVQSQWDNSTKSSTKLKDKLEYLNNAYDLQKDKVNLLKQELDELENSENRDEKAIQKKTNQLIQAETKLNNYKNRINETNAMLKTGTINLAEYGKKFEDAGNLIEEAGKKFQKFSLASSAGLTASLKTAIDFEDAFAGVIKTVDATDEQIEELRKGIIAMSTELPASTTEISSVTEAAGQLGIQADNILSFTKTMIDLGESTNLTADEAASQLAKFANIMQMSQKDFDKLGSTIVDLGNNFATTESDIVEMAMRLAGAGKQVGLTEGEVLGLATALSSVGIEAEMGGSAISKAMIKMQNAVELGGDKLNTVLKKTGMNLRELELMAANDSKGFKEMSQSIGMTSTEVKQLITAGTNLEDFAKVSGMTTEQFKKAWKEDAAGALSAFIKGLGDAENKGESAISMLSEMGLTEVRLRDSLLRAANAGNLFNDAISNGNNAWKSNTALTNEANKRYATLKSQFDIMINKIKAMAINLGTKMMPTVEKIVTKIGNLVEKFIELDDKTAENIIKISLFVAALSPTITIIGKTTSAIGKTINAVTTFSEALKVSQGVITSTNSTVNGLATIMSAVKSPIGLACVGISAAIIAIKSSSDDVSKSVKSNFEAMGTSATEFLNGIDSAQSHINAFNTTLFASNEEQQKLAQNMTEIQQGINEIAKKASDERRSYTDAEVKQLDSYFEKLRELKDKELEIQQQIGVAITQQAKTSSDSFSGSLEEYKVLSQEWIKTAQDQANAEISIINQRTIEEIALLNTRYGEKANMENAEYAREYNAIIAKKESSIAQANEEVAKVNAIYSNGYTSRATESDTFMQKITESNSKIADEEQRHATKIKEIQDGMLEDKKNNDHAFLEAEKGKNAEFGTEQQRIVNEDIEHSNTIKNIWKNMYENMSESEAKQLGSWLAMVSQTEMYGGKIDDETQKVVDGILSSYDSMPESTRKVMENAMKPMLEEMEKKEPSLFTKATNIANGILNRLKKAFDIHSPSRKTRAIFRNVMKGSELGVEDEEKNLYKQTEQIAKNVQSEFENIKPNTDFIDNIRSSSNSGNISGYTLNNGNYLDIDYEKLSKAFLKALNTCKLSLDRDGFIKFIQNVIYEVM